LVWSSGYRPFFFSLVYRSSWVGVMCDYFSSILVSVLCNWGHLQILWWFSYYSFSHSMGLNLLMCYSWLCIMSCSFDCCICLSLHLYYKKVCTMPLCNTKRCPVMLLRLQPNMYFLCDFMFVLVSDCRSWSSKHNWELQVVPHGMFIYKAVIYAVRCWNFFFMVSMMICCITESYC